MEKPDPYADWVLFPTGEKQPQSIAPDQELLSAARAAWPGALDHAERQFSAARLGSDGAAFAVQVWEQLLRSVSKARRRNRDQRSPISNLEGYLMIAFRRRFTRVLVREQKRAEMIELVSSSFDLERIESAKNADWVDELALRKIGCGGNWHSRVVKRRNSTANCRWSAATKPRIVSSADSRARL